MHFLHGPQVSFADVLAAKEERAQLQAELRVKYNSPVVSITANIPGAVKYSEETVDLVYCALAKMRRQIKEAHFILWEERLYHLNTGPVALIAVEGNAQVIKELGISLEEGVQYGRLIDIDVFDAAGRQINRAILGLKERSCFVCGANAVACMRSHAHQQAEVFSAVKKLLNHHQAETTYCWSGAVEMIGTTALEAMLMETACTPAPGLVDRFNSGAHQDMDFFTFLKSSSALAPAMYRCALAGWNHHGPAEGLLPVLRHIGNEAEKAMLAATAGINTQRGLLFLLGILTGAAARSVRNDGKDGIIEATLREAARICCGIVERELERLKDRLPERQLTSGERLYLAYGVTGIRGEIAAGLPTVKSQGLPCLIAALDAGLTLNDALLHSLLGIMTETQDTTILSRHDSSTLALVQTEAGAIMAEGGMLTAAGQKRVRDLDKTYSQKRISPGGSADLLAATYFLYYLEQKIHLAKND